MTFKGTFYSVLLLVAIAFAGIKVVKWVKQVQSGGYQDHGNQVSGNLSRNGLGQFLRAKKENSLERIQSAGVSKECASYVQTLESLDLSAFLSSGFAVTYNSIPEISPACVISDEWVSTAEKDYLKSCLLSNPTKTEVLANNCVESIFELRSALTHFLIQDKNMRDLDSLPELTDLLYAEWIHPTLKNETPNFKKMGLISTRISELRSDLFLAEKIKILSEAIEAKELSQGKTLKQQDQIWERPAEDLETLQASQGAGGLSDLNRMIQTHGFENTLTQEYAKSVKALHPDSGEALFLEALVEWRQGEQEVSLTTLKKALAADPSNLAFKTADEALKSPGAGEEIFLNALHTQLTVEDFDK